MWKEIRHVEKPDYSTSHPFIWKTNGSFTETFSFSIGGLQLCIQKGLMRLGVIFGEYILHAAENHIGYQR